MSALPLFAPTVGAAAVWRADELARPPGLVLATGHALLDSQLPGGGWPVGALVEILQAQSGQNEWRLLLPALKRRPAGPVVLVGAPHVPFGPGLAAQGLDLQSLLWITSAEPAARMWACEQALRCAPVSVVLAWLLRHPARISAVIGSSDPARIRACAQAQDLTLSREHWYRLYESARGQELP